MTPSTLDAVKALGAPLFIILLGMVVLLLDLGEGAGGVRRRRLLSPVSILGLIGAAVIAARNSGLSDTFFGGGMIADNFAALFAIVLCLVAALAILMSDGYLAERGMQQGEYYALILFATSGAMLMAQSHDLVNVFVGLEVLSVALYILSGFARRERKSEESAVKYFLLGAFASGFLLYGTALVYGAVGLTAHALGVAISGPSYTNFAVIGEVLTASGGTATPLVASPIFVAGVAFLIVGLGFKAAIVPFHSYAPDVYEGAPTPVAAFMSVAAKVGAFAALIRLLGVLAGAGATGPFHAVLWGLAVATMVVGNVLAVRQTNIKRMLAYSSIAHAGYILVGVVASLNPATANLAQEAVRYYLFAYTFMNLGAFALVVWLGRAGTEWADIRDYAGLGRRNPLAAFAMTVFMLSLAGIPPTAGFLGKLYVFLSAIQAHEPVLACIGLVVSAIGVFYYLNIIVTMYFREPVNDFAGARAGGGKWAALLCAAATIVFGIVPSAVLPDLAGATAESAAGEPFVAPGNRTPRPRRAPVRGPLPKFAPVEGTASPAAAPGAEGAPAAPSAPTTPTRPEPAPVVEPTPAAAPAATNDAAPATPPAPGGTVPQGSRP